MRSIPGVTVDRVNVAGSESGQQSQFVAKGSDPKDSVWSIDGVVITDMAAIGSSPDYFTFDSFEEINFSTAGSGVQVATGGLGINLAAKRGTNDFHGNFNGFFTHDDLQWSNIPDELVGDARLLGNDKADHTQQIFDWSGDLGGPILKDRLWFYGSYGENDIRVKRLNQSSDKTRLTTYTAKLNWQATPNDMVSLFWFQGGKEKIGRTGGAGGLAHLDGTLWDQGKAWPGNPHGLTKLEWSRTFGPTFFLNVKGSLYNTGFSLAPQGGLEDDRWIIDNVQAEGRGTAYGQFFERPQKTATADASYFASGLGGSHEIRFGGGFRRVGSTTTRTNPGLKLNGRYNATSTRVRVWRDASTESEADYWSGYLSDTFTKDRFTVNAGPRFDHQASIKKPSQIAGNPLGNGLLPDVDFAGDTEAPVVWTTVSPRLGLTLALDESRKTVARVSGAIYRGQMPNTEAGWNNPLGNAYVEYDWSDANGDDTVQPGEIDYSRLRGFLGIDPGDPDALESSYTFDPDYHANKDYEVVAGLDRELAPNLAASVAYTFRKSTDLTATQLLWGYYWYPWAGVTRADYAPGEAFCASGYCTTPLVLDDAVFDRPEVTTGAVLTNRNDYSRTYHGLELSLVKRLSNQWMGRVAFSLNDWREHLGPQSYGGQDGASTGNPNRNYSTRRRTAGWWPPTARGPARCTSTARGGRSPRTCSTGSLGRRGGRQPPRAPGVPEPHLRAARRRLARRGLPRAGGRHRDGRRAAARPVEPRHPGGEGGEDRADPVQLSAEVFNAFNSGTELTRVNDFSADAYRRLDEILAPRIVRFGARVSSRRTMGRSRKHRPTGPGGRRPPGPSSRHRRGHSARDGARGSARGADPSSPPARCRSTHDGRVAVAEPAHALSRIRRGHPTRRPGVVTGESSRGSAALRARGGRRGARGLAPLDRRRRPPRGRPERPARHRRHAAGRRPRLLRPPRAATPWMDRLAAEGVRFERAHAHNVTTLPSHANILSGRLPFGPRRPGQLRVPLPGADRDARHPAAGPRLPDRGLRERVSPRLALRARAGLRRLRRQLRGRRGAAGMFLSRSAPGPTRSASRAAASTRRGRALVLLGPPLRAPLPLRAPGPLASRFRGEPYQGEVAAADAALGPLLEPLLAAGRARRHAVVLTSDHGESLGEHGEATHGIFAYEATLRVPLVLHAAADPPAEGGARARRGTSTSCRPSSTRSRLPVPEGLPGRSLLALAAGERAEEPADLLRGAVRASSTGAGRRSTA